MVMPKPCSGDFNKYGKQLIFKCNLNAKDTEKLEIKSRFLKDILLAWSNVNFRDDISNIGKEIIWNNTNIKSNIKPFFFTIGWIKASSSSNIYMTIEINSFLALMKYVTYITYPKLTF